MEPISWATIAGLLVKYAPEVIDRILANAQNNKPVTVAEWEDLKKMLPFDQLVPKRPTP